MCDNGNVKLYKGDCLEVMNKLVEEGIEVDLTVTSPPYDDLRNYNNSLVWDFEVFKKVANLLYAITKKGGVVVWVVNDKTKKGSESGTSFKQALYFKEIGFNLHDTMIYAKNNPIPLNHNRYEQQFEYMFILSKGKPKVFNPIKVKCSYAGNNNSKGTFRQNGDNLEPSHKKGKVKDFKIKSNIWFFNVGNTNTKDKNAKNHPAIFPEQLANEHILSWSNEGDTVLDCFLGSGTTGKMAILNNRKFIGIEKVEEYFNMAQKKINQAKEKTIK